MENSDNRLIAVKVHQLYLSNLGFVVMLKSDNDPRSLPIFIGAAEAQAIQIRLTQVEVPRPLTHDLLKNVLDSMECRLLRVEICDLREGTFYAALVLARDGAQTRMDARPSDAIALALRFDAPIFVEPAVMDAAGKEMETTPEGGAEVKKEKRKLTPLEALQRQLDRVIGEERYEEAARLRDEIQRLKGTHTTN